MLDLLTFIIVGIAAGYLLLKLKNAFYKDSNSGKGCGNCAKGETQKPS